MMIATGCVKRELPLKAGQKVSANPGGLVGSEALRIGDLADSCVLGDWVPGC